MRTLRIVVSTSKGILPALVLATLLPAAAATCAATVQTSSESAASATGTGGASSSSSSQGGQGGSFVASVSASSSSGGDPDAGPMCGPSTFEHSITVAVPPPGVPATPGAICAVMVNPVGSNTAARVTLTKYSSALNAAMGFVAIDPAIAAALVGTPTIAVVWAGVPALLPMQASNIQPVAGGFSFHADWPLPFNIGPDSSSQMQIKATLTLACDPMMMDTRVVESLTFIDLCLGATDYTWVSSGETCKVCDIIAEMAPSPIVPETALDDLPLGRVLRLRITVLARIGGALVLLAENDGGDGLSYAWHTEGGKVEEIAPDVVVWTPPLTPGPHLIQTVVESDDAAAVASFTFQEAA